MATAVCGQASQYLRWCYLVPDNDKDLKGQSPLPDNGNPPPIRSHQSPLPPLGVLGVLGVLDLSDLPIG